MVPGTVRTELAKRGFVHEGTGGNCSAYRIRMGSIYEMLVTDGDGRTPILMSRAVTASKVPRNECEPVWEKTFGTMVAFLHWWDRSDR